MIAPPETTGTGAQQIVFIRLTIPREEMRNAMGPALGEIHAALAAQTISPAGPWFTHHLRMDPAVFDFEVCVPVSALVSPTGRVEAGEKPPLSVVRTIYTGPCEQLGAAWGEFDAWIAANGHAVRGDLYETYAAGPESGPDPASWRTELSRPLLT